jgi:hypothetical protein
MKKHIVIVTDEWFINNLKVFSHPEHCKVTRTVIEDDTFKDDPTWKDLLKAKQKADKEFRDYEFDKRHKHKK